MCRSIDDTEARWTGTWCPHCGPDVSCDEDGCCAACGATAVGEGVEQALALRARLEPATGAEEVDDCPLCDGLGEDPRPDRQCGHCGGTGVAPARQARRVQEP